MMEDQCFLLYLASLYVHTSWLLLTSSLSSSLFFIWIRVSYS